MRPWVANLALIHGIGWVTFAERRLSGGIGGGTGERKHLIGDDGNPVIFLDKQDAQDAIDAAIRNDGPWGPTHQWSSY